MQRYWEENRHVHQLRAIWVFFVHGTMDQGACLICVDCMLKAKRLIYQRFACEAYSAALKS